MRQRILLVLFTTLLFPLLAAAQLRVVSHGPEGETRTLEEANEIRVTFSEPMVAVGSLAGSAEAPWFQIDPRPEGELRWSGTSTLIFRPAEGELRYATPYRVRIGTDATSIHGSRLAAPFSFSFTTPAVRLERTMWYEKPNGAIVFALRFNQPIVAEKLLPHVKLALEPHEPQFGNIQPPAAVATTTDPSAIRDFEAKKAEVEKQARSSRKVMGFIPASWDRSRLRTGPNDLVIETQPGLPPGAWVKISIDANAPSPAGPATPGAQQDFVAMLGPGFFVARATCVAKCNPDWRHPIELTDDVALEDLAAAIRVTDVTTPGKPVLLSPVQKRRDESGTWYDTRLIALEDLGYRIEPAHTYRVIIDKSLRSRSGVELGYTWGADLEYWHRLAFSSFGEGHGVWESDGGPLVPFWARNLRNVDQWLHPLSKNELMPALIAAERSNFRQAPPGTPTLRQLRPVPDQLQSYGVDASSILGPSNRGLFRAAIRDGETIPRAELRTDESGKPRPVSTIVQTTDLGLTLKQSPIGMLVWVTRLSDGSPVANASVEIRDRQNAVRGSAFSGADGVALFPGLGIRRHWWDTEFIAIAEKDGDLAYVASNWHQNILPWMFGLSFDAEPVVDEARGVFFTDRGVYRPGETVQTKLILRKDEGEAIALYPAGTPVAIELLNPRSDTIVTTTATLNEWSSAEWSWKVPASAVFGNWMLRASVTKDQPVVGEFLVAAYRRPEFRVDVDLGAPTPVAGSQLQGAIDARYLFGGTMGGLPVRWRYTWRPAWETPLALENLFPARRFVWTDQCGLEERFGGETLVEENETTLDSAGSLVLDLETEMNAGIARRYQLEAEVTDVSRQTIANRTRVVVHPADFYVGIRQNETFLASGSSLQTEIVTATPAGEIVPGVAVKLSLVQIQWHSVRRAEGNGFYTWETERREIPAGEWTVTTGNSPVPFNTEVPSGGLFRLIATATDGSGRSATSCFSFYAAGEGYTAWERFDHNRIELLPEKNRYKPGETARLLIKSPWESATVLMTVEREGIRSHRSFPLESTQQAIEVPVTEELIPNAFVSVVLVKGRSEAAIDEGGSDPGKPSFRIGYAEIQVEDAAKRLDVDVRPAVKELRPGASTTIEVGVRDAAGNPSDAEVTLWAVDYGVLSLTGYEMPEAASAVWREEALRVITADSRQKIIARRALTPKGSGEGGGGGAALGSDAMRSDFRPLAFWLGSLETGADGVASAQVTMPDTLTTWRVMAVAADRQSRFGSGETEIRTNKPVLLRAAFPRFLTVGDEARFGAVANNQLTRGGRATVTIKSLDPEVLDFRGGTGRRVDLAPNGAEAVRFLGIAKAPGVARIEMTVRLAGEIDSFRDTIPVLLPVSPEADAAYGTVPPGGSEVLRIPPDALPDFGALRIDLASTALVGLSEGAAYLIDYPYGCAEQRASALFAMITAAELSDLFDVAALRIDRQVIEATIAELEQFQCDSGAFAFWKGACSFASPYVSAWMLHVLHLARELGYEPRQEMLDRAYSFLQFSLAEEPEIAGGWVLQHSAWQAFAIRELAAGGVDVAPHIQRMRKALDRSPIFALAWLHDALLIRNEGSGALAIELRRRMRNAILEEGGASHVQELQDPILEFLWSSNVRTTAIVLRSLTASGEDERMTRSMVRWLMEARRNGRWGSTQENAWAMEALIAWAQKYESETPDFAATATLADEQLAAGEFRGRSVDVKQTLIPMRELAPLRGVEAPLTFAREGTGTLNYGLHLRYARPLESLQALDRGFQIERTYQRDDSTPAGEGFTAGDLIRVTLRIRVPKERIWVAVSDPLPAGLEPVDAWFRTTASDLAEEASDQGSGSWLDWYQRGGFDHVEKRDDRVDLFATRLGEGEHVFSYLVRAMTGGVFRAAPTRAEEMYRPENFGRTGVATLRIDEERQ
jgi:alpha-2-macroglobulin